MAVTSSTIYKNVTNSISGKSIHHDTTYKVTDNGDTFKPIATFDPAGDNNTSSGLGKFTSVCIINEGNQPLEVQMELAQFSNTADTKSANSLFLTTILNPNKLIYLPTSNIFEYSNSGSKQSASYKISTGGSGAAATFVNPNQDLDDGGSLIARSDGKTRDAAGIIRSGTTGTLANAADTSLVVGDGDYFKKSDLIKMASETLEVTDVSGTTLTVRRGIFGTTAATHSSVVVSHYYLNENKDVGIYTNRKGFYSATSFFAYGRDSAYPMGIVPGSVAIKFYEPAYLEFGMNNQTSNTESGLSASTAYGFNITPDNAGSATQIDFTTDSSNTKWGGKNGVLEKINDGLKAKFDDNTFKFLPVASLVGGDIRFTSGSRITGTTANYGSSVVLANPSSGTTMFGVNRIPASTAFYELIESQVPTDDNLSKIMFDDGMGNLTSSQGSGTIDYETGAISLSGPANAEFLVSAYYNSALSGDVTGDRDNYLISIHAKSLNQFRDGKLRVIAIDDGKDDTIKKSKVRGINR